MSLRLEETDLFKNRQTGAHPGRETPGHACRCFHDKIHRLDGFPQLTKGREVRRVGQRVSEAGRGDRALLPGPSKDAFKADCRLGSWGDLTLGFPLLSCRILLYTRISQSQHIDDWDCKTL